MKIWLGVVTAAAMVAPLSAQSAAELKRWSNDVTRSVRLPSTPIAGLAGGCTAGPIAGASGLAGIIGEKMPAPEVSQTPSGSTVLANSWQSDGFSKFDHVIEGKPGRVTLTLDACTSASGGETVALYPVDARGLRKTPRLLFVIATLRGNARSGSIILPPPPRGQKVSRLPVVVIVENASRRLHSGAYRLTIAR